MLLCIYTNHAKCVLNHFMTFLNKKRVMYVLTMLKIMHYDHQPKLLVYTAKDAYPNNYRQFLYFFNYNHMPQGSAIPNKFSHR